MTIEQQQQLDQSAFDAAKSVEQRDKPISTAIERSHVAKWFKMVAQTILDNPGEWGLTSDPYKDLMRVEISDDLKAQLSRLRSTLLEVHELLRMADPHCRDSALEEMKDIIEVALKQQDDETDNTGD